MAMWLGRSTMTPSWWFSREAAFLADPCPDATAYPRPSCKGYQCMVDDQIHIARLLQECYLHAQEHGS